MKKRTRRILFYFSVLMFVLVGWLVLLFALGYKYDFVQNKFFKTGSFEIKTNASAQVYINDELAGSTSFLGDSYSKGRLLPRTYNIRVDSEGYQSWRKLIKIEAGFLSSFPKVVLMPQNFDEELVASSSLANIINREFDKEHSLAIVGNRQKTETINLKNGEKEILKQSPIPVTSVGPKITTPNYIISPDENKNLWFTDHEIWIKWIKDSRYQPYMLAGDEELVTRFSQKISDAQWYKDSEHLIVNAGGVLEFVEIDGRDGINIFDITTISGPFYYDRDMDAIFKFEGNKLLRIDLK